jgi:hypothetical protein
MIKLHTLRAVILYRNCSLERLLTPLHSKYYIGTVENGIMNTQMPQFSPNVMP